MTDKHTTAEAKFLKILEAEYKKDNGISDIEQKALNALGVQFKKQGESTVTDILNTLQDVVEDKYNTEKNSDSGFAINLKTTKSIDPGFDAGIATNKNIDPGFSYNFKAQIADQFEIELPKVPKLAKEAGIKI